MAASGEPDETLMARTANGDRACLELLVRRHATPLLTFLARLAGDRHRAEELFQEVFLAVWAKRRQYQHPRPFKAWLYAIAVNKCRAAFRVQPTWSAPLNERDTAAAAVAPADAMMAAETADLVGRAVARLPEQQRAVVTLRISGGAFLRPHRRDRRLHGSHGALHMHHGLAALRKHLEHKLARHEC